VPAGNRDGGQWTTVSSGGGISIALPASVVSADEGTGAIDDFGDAGDFGGTGGAQDFGLDWVQLAGDIPSGDPPEIPEKRPPTSQGRTAVLKGVARRIVLTGEAVAIVAKIASWLSVYSPSIQSYNDPPKSLDELQRAVSTPAPGYDTHHIVQRNQESVFGKEVINSRENLVLIPRIKHWDINQWYETPNPKFDRESPRQYLNGRNWNVQRAVGLEALEKAGVLKR
jgi:hypothetical protein